MRLLQARTQQQPRRGSETPGQAIRVQTRGGLPARVEWHGRTFHVESVEAIWCIEGRWWLDSDRQGARRRCFRVMLRNINGAPLCVDILRQGEHWKIWSIAD